MGLAGGLALAVAGLAGFVTGPLFGAAVGIAFAALMINRVRTAGGGLLWALAFALAALVREDFTRCPWARRR